MRLLLNCLTEKMLTRLLKRGNAFSVGVNI